MQNPLVPGLFTHETNNVTFVLWVDNVLVKYTTDEEADQFLTALQEIYTISVDKEAKRYVGLKLNWDWNKRTCTIIMPGYIKAVMHNFNHPHLKKLQDSPHKCKGKYGDGQKPLPTPQVKKK